MSPQILLAFLLTTGGVCFGFALRSHLRDPKAPGPGYWAAGYLCFVFSLPVFVLRFGPPVDTLRALLVFTGVHFQLRGFASFHGQPRLHPRSFAFVALAAALATLGADLTGLADWRLALDLFFPCLLVFDTLRYLRGLGRGARPVPSYIKALFMMTFLGTLRMVVVLAIPESREWLFRGQAETFLSLGLAAFIQGLALWQTHAVTRYLNDRNRDLSRELAESQQEILSTMAGIIDSSSRETSDHVLRVGRMAERLGRAAGMGKEESRMLGQAAQLHDIGKLGIPDTILDKPGCLDQEEMQIMRTHTRIGHQILSRSRQPLFAMAARIALEHHENWDGTGYPQGLEGDHISLEARITAICDVVDALSHDRIYKCAWPMAAVRDHLLAERGRRFDPVLVDLFLSKPRMFPDGRQNGAAVVMDFYGG